MTKPRRSQGGTGTRAGWTPTMEQIGRSLEGRQVKCLTADEGHVWMGSFDRLPPIVRRRLAQSPFNICAACMDIEAHRAAPHPTVEVYFAVIEAIERRLRPTAAGTAQNREEQRR
jgi:hypothetical protein